jgi:hypothetical protein
MQQLTLEPEEFVDQLPAGSKAAVEALRELQEKVRAARRRMPRRRMPYAVCRAPHAARGVSVRPMHPHGLTPSFPSALNPRLP